MNKIQEYKEKMNWDVWEDLYSNVPVYVENQNMLVPYYLMHSYLYYEKDDPIISDHEFDLICKTLYEKWDKVEHFHKHLINKDDLIAGTGYALKYPERVKNAAKHLLKERKK